MKQMKQFSALIIATVVTFAMALEIKPYESAAFEQALANPGVVILDFAASWCPTCKKQGEIQESLKEDPRFEEVTVFRADFDTETELKKQYRVAGQSTLIRFENGEETSRVRGVTNPTAMGDFFVPAVPFRIEPYSVNALAEANKTDVVVILDFHASWCPTCRAQAESFQAIEASGMLNNAVVFKVDYDSEKALKKQYRVANQSTLILLKKGSETDRVMGVTSVDAISSFITGK